MMVLSTKQLSSTHAIEQLIMKIAVNNENIERVPSTKLLGTNINQDLKWEDTAKYICASWYIRNASKSQKSVAFTYQEKPCPSICPVEIIL